MSERVVPTCRYQHGPLKREEQFWSVQQMQKLDQPMQPDQNFIPTSIQFVFSLFRCARCGYMEMFDDEEAA
jgi:hypothetical protein